MAMTSATARMILGMKKGTTSNAAKTILPRKRWRVSARAAMAPSVVAIAAVGAAIRMELASPPSRRPSWMATSYQPSVNPVMGNASISALLNENSATTATGRYMKA